MSDWQSERHSFQESPFKRSRTSPNPRDTWCWFLAHSRVEFVVTKEIWEQINPRESTQDHIQKGWRYARSSFKSDWRIPCDESLDECRHSDKGHTSYREEKGHVESKMNFNCFTDPSSWHSRYNRGSMLSLLRRIYYETNLIIFFSPFLCQISCYVCPYLWDTQRIFKIQEKPSYSTSLGSTAGSSGSITFKWQPKHGNYLATCSSTDNCFNIYDRRGDRLESVSLPGYVSTSCSQRGMPLKIPSIRGKLLYLERESWESIRRCIWRSTGEYRMISLWFHLIPWKKQMSFHERVSFIVFLFALQ